jgi:poly(3-hydroxybutyrate) depolymerase
MSFAFMRFVSVAILVACSSTSEEVAPQQQTDAEEEVATDTEVTIDSETPDTVVATDTGMPLMDTAPPTIDRSKCTADPDKVGLVTRTVPGKTKTYLAYVPATYDKMKPTTLVIALHGAGDVASNYLNVVWKLNADKRNFIVIAPDGNCAAGPGNTWCSGDSAMIASLWPDMEACYSIDPKRRIIDGFSAGGIMAYAMGLEGASFFAGISISASNLGSAEAIVGKKLLPAPWKIPVSHHHGTMDMNFPIATAREGRDRLIAAGHMVYWHEFAGGHTTTPAFALERYDDLASSRAP